MNLSDAGKLMEDIFSSMQRSGMIPEDVVVTPETVILGNGSVLDSLGFVTFISDLEEKLCDATGKELYLVLDEIHEFNTEKTSLSVGILTKFIQQLAS